ncbi:hypothetical protein [Streptomyces pseudovenezuelae]|uniref:LmbE family N-acetylglucosaminyl deacetylase n=1 Tax=Streptomyces pseudovenezuelae TaxID=67350 RepID=A0ABT6M3Q3_9ACTN|nr:LmbE family N-acetylglucosaminyl deacetylase [Streptomyces pseudovenezuelae]
METSTSPPVSGVPSVLGVFSHPDDESLLAGGVLARHAAASACTAVVTATWCPDSTRAADLAVLHERIASARALGEDPQRAARIRAYGLRRLDDYRHAAETWLHTGGYVVDTSTLTRKRTLTAALDHLRQGEPAVCAESVSGRELQ